MSLAVPTRTVLQLGPRMGLLAVLWLGTAGYSVSQDEGLGPLSPAEAERLSARSLSDWEGTPLPVVEKMLELAHVRPGEMVYDLGSGDGRIVILAAQKFGARAVGIELDTRRARLSLERIDRLGLSGQVQIIQGDVLEQDLSPADVVTVYMTRYAIQKLQPRFDKFLHDGTRLVVCADELPGRKPAQTVSVTAENKRTYELRLYVFARHEDWTSFSKFGKRR